MSLPADARLTPVVRRILAGNALSAIGNGMVLPLLIVYLGQVRGLGTQAAGLVVAYMALVGLVLLWPSGSLVDRYGPRPILMAGLVVEGVGVILLTQVQTVAMAFGVATVLAAGRSFSWSPQAALLGRLTPAEGRQRAFGIQFMLMNLGIGIGGIVSALVADVESVSSFTTLYLIDAVTFFLYVVVLLTMPGVGVGPAAHDEALGAPPRGGYREVFSDRRLLRFSVMALVLLTCGWASMDVGLPTIMTVINGLDVAWVAVAFTVNTATIVLMQMVSLRFIRGRSRTRMFAVVAVLWAASWLILGASSLVPMTVSIVAACLSTVVFAMGETLVAPIGPSLVNDLAPDHLRGRYNSVQSVVWSVANALGPAMAGFLLGAELVGVWVAVVSGGSLMAGALALSLRKHLTAELDGRETQPSGTMRA
ncbi:MAG: MFS transporter [Actinomycetales bacterium]|nr:MFS transporter [Actinomycetales bacterium]